MYTQCPHCQTIFGVSEAHLSAAFGRVRCGHCRGQFNAKRHLLDELPEQAEHSDTSSSDTDEQADRNELTLAETATDEINHLELPTPEDSPAEAQIQVELTDDEPIDRPEISGLPPRLDDRPEKEQLDAIFAALDNRLEELAGNTDEAIIKPFNEFKSRQVAADYQDSFEDLAQQSETAESALDLAAHQAPTPTSEDVFSIEIDTEAEEDTQTADSTGPDPAETDHDTSNAEAAPTDLEPPELTQEELPFMLHDALQAEQAAPRGWLKSIGLFSLIIFLLTTIGFQLALFRNVELANRLPVLKPYLLTFCQHLPCQFSGQRDIKQIQLTSRDVRSHPKGKNTILISAIFVNNARFDQPYPDILITLSDLTTTIIAQRRFTPQDYLAQVANTFQLMKSGQPIHISLEVLDPGNDAVNFQFEFL